MLPLLPCADRIAVSAGIAAIDLAAILEAGAQRVKASPIAQSAKPGQRFEILASGEIADHARTKPANLGEGGCHALRLKPWCADLRGTAPG